MNLQQSSVGSFCSSEIIVPEPSPIKRGQGQGCDVRHTGNVLSL